MRSIVRMVCVLALVSLPFRLVACDSPVHAEKKPVGLRTAGPDEPNYDLTVQDRAMWKSVLHWCDECDERASFVTQQGGRGGIAIYPLNKTQYIVVVECEMAMQQSELIFYKVTEHPDTIESRLLPLEQYDFIQTREDVRRLHAKQSGDPYAELQDVGKFIRFTDTLIYGGVIFTGKNRNLLVVEHRYRGMGGCGLLTVYDVSGDCPKVVEFRGKTYCSANYVPPEKWKLYPAKVRAKWRTAPNPLRKDWKNKDQCR